MTEYDEADTVELPLPKSEHEPWRKTISALTEVDLGACSHQGKVRTNNEDCFLVSRIERSLTTLLTNLPAGHVPDQNAEVAYGMLVADGMGGAVAGEVASSLAISTLVELVMQTPDWHMRLDNEGVNEVLARFDQRFGKVREALIERAQADPSLEGMGTTMTLAVSLGPNLIIAHVGDSRAYLFHKNRLHLLTRDQTMAQSLAELGIIQPEDVATHPARHVLTGAIATQGEEAQAELCQVWLADGDQVLLCTDGLTDMVTDADISEVLGKHGPAADAARALVDLALEGGGRDNVTVVLGRYRIPEERG
jgi:PPM family protein phosphatase